MRKWRRRRNRQAHRRWLTHIDQIGIGRLIQTRWFRVVWRCLMLIAFLGFLLWMHAIAGFVRGRILAP